MPSMDRRGAERTAQRAGWVTSIAGLVLALAPRRVANVAGVTDLRTIAYLAVTDLGLAPGLLVSRRKGPWLAARALVNLLGIGLLLREPSTRARVTAAGLLAITVVDAEALRTLSRRPGVLRAVVS